MKKYFQISLLVFSLIIILLNQLNAQTASTQIRLNQVGYYPAAPKIAIIVGDENPGKFEIVGIDQKQVFFSGSLSDTIHSNNSTLYTRIADFSKFTRPGKYVIRIKDVGYSYPFAIGKNANHSAAKASLKGFYFQRVSMPLEEKYAGKWNRPAGHPDTEVLVHPSAATSLRPANTVIACPGGWYDAGDYNKYIVNSGITMGTLLSAYEDFSTYFDTLHTNIPESRDRIPDILDEIIYNLRWMLTMQDPNDGGVYNKCTNAAFDGMVMPGVTKLPRYVVQKGTAATLDFAAVTAQAARILKKFNSVLPGLADSCIKASKYAWTWAEKNPNLEYNQNAINKTYAPPITTGGYGDRNFIDEWFWAACELYCTTKDEAYYKMISDKMNRPWTLPSWGNVYLLGFYSMVRNEKHLTAHRQDIKNFKTKIVDFANGYDSAMQKNAFRTVMGRSRADFVWGSNSNAANQGIALINAYLISGDKKFVNDALSNLDYILGRNATGFCFVTGLGTHSTMHPHHRQSVADEIDDPVPGLLAGGPNPGRQDGCHYDFFDPETAYSDIDCAYASNEIAINWNAPLVYLSNALEALQLKVGYTK